MSNPTNPALKTKMLGAFATTAALATCACIAVGSLIGLSTWMLSLLIEAAPLQF
jgi:hypothetical protein